MFDLADRPSPFMQQWNNPGPYEGGLLGDIYTPMVNAHRREQAARIAGWDALQAQYDTIDDRIMIRGMSLSGALARFQKEGRSEDFINGYLEGLKARG